MHSVFYIALICDLQVELHSNFKLHSEMHINRSKEQHQNIQVSRSINANARALRSWGGRGPRVLVAAVALHRIPYAAEAVDGLVVVPAGAGRS